MLGQPAQTVVERLLRRGKARFFADTCVLLNARSVSALQADILSFLHSHDCPLVVPFPVTVELERHSMNRRNPDLAKKAEKALAIVCKRQTSGHIRLLGSPNEKFADQTFLEVFTRFRTKYDLLLFTQDKGLCRDLLRLNDMESTSRCANEIWVAWHTGREFLAARRVADMAHAPRTPRASRSKRPEPLFKKCSKPRVLENKLVGGRERFREGQMVRTEKGESFRLSKSLAAGGEGEIFVIDKSRVAKIYFPDRRTAWRAEKLGIMCGKEVPLSHVSWPQARLFSTGNHFVGYIMPLAEGVPLQHAVFGKATIQEKFPRWNRLNLVTLARTVAETVRTLNDLGVIVGDLNPMNFLVAGDSEVHLVDVDSVQIEDFPCPVGMANFRAPEITEPSFEKFLRNDQHEAFALATMLFMILMGGKPPFSFQGGGDPAENIRKGNFPYVTDHGLIPAGAYRYIWSFFPYAVKMAFTQAFNGKDPKSRPSAARWVQILTEYCKELQNPKIVESLEIWPSSFKPWDNETSIQLRCGECSTVFQTSARDAEKRRRFPKILCNTCVTVLVLAKKAGENHTCKKCSKLFRVDFHEVQRHGDVLKVCQKCVAQVAAQPRTCKECGRTFTLEVGETRFLLAKDLCLPKRCGHCRGKVTPTRPVMRQPKQYGGPPPRPYNPPPPRPSQESSFWDTLKSFFG
jgi:ribosomal protein L40E